MHATLYRQRHGQRPPQPSSCLRLFLFMLACWLMPCPAMPGNPVPNKPAADRPIHRLAAALVDAPRAMRADFAVAAIAEMVADCNEEADQARREARRHGKGRDLNKWAGAVNAYAAQLTAIADSVTPETPVTVTVGAGNSLSLDIDGKPVMVSSPRVREQAAFEQRVLDRFCQRYPCADLIAEYRPPPAATPTETQTYWSFSQQAGPTCSSADGLEFQFQDMTDIAGKRAACARIVEELNALAAALATAVANGSRIDWNRLAIHTRPGEEEQRVELGGEGNSFGLPLPALAATDRLFQLVRPWLAARVDGQAQYRLVLINAESLMSPLLDSSGQSALTP